MRKENELESEPSINFDRLDRALEEAISAFPVEGNADIDLQAHLVNLRLKELRAICTKLNHQQGQKATQ